MINAPRYPEDFQLLFSEGASYHWWSPFTGPDYDGTWPSDQAPPSGLMIGGEDSASAHWEPDEKIYVGWTYHDTDGPQVFVEPKRLDGGSEYFGARSQQDIQDAIDEVVRMVNEESKS